MQWAADNDRAVLTQDIRTMPDFAHQRIVKGLPTQVPQLVGRCWGCRAGFVGGLCSAGVWDPGKGRHTFSVLRA